MAKARPILLLLLLTAILAQPRTAQGQESLTLSPSATLRFGEGLRFGLRADGAGEVTAMTLFLQPEGSSNVYRADVPFQPSDTLEVAVDVPASAIGLRPYQRVSYGWELQTTNGAHRVAPEMLAYADDRFTWQALQQDGLAAYWTGAEGPFLGEQVLEAARAALDEAGPLLPLMAVRPFAIYVYPSSADLRDAQSRLALDSAALSAADIILVTAVNPQSAVAELGQSVPPAVLELLLNQTAGGVAGQPWWLRQGLGGRLQAQRDPRAESLLAAALAAGTTLPLSTLCGAPSESGDASLLAAAQSTAVVDYLLRTKGETAVRELFAAYDGGADCASGAQQALGLSLDDLDAAWRSAAGPRAPLGGFWADFGLIVVLLLGGSMLAALLYRVTRRGLEMA